MIAGALYLTQGQHFDVLGFNFFAFRFLEVAGFIRVTMRREFSFSKLNRIDRPFIILYLFATVVFLLRSNEGQAYQIGLATDAFLCYFTFRGLVGGVEDFRWFLCTFVILLVPYLVLLLIERLTGQNPFAVLNAGLDAAWLRDDKVRCFGSFRNPSILGSLGASFLPLYIGLSFSRSKRLYAITGVILSLGIVWLSNSGGPMSFAVFGILGWTLWIFRNRMRIVRRGGLVLIAAVALVMKAPIWYLPTHFSFGGDAWHRSYLMEVAMQHIGEWWLWGMPIAKTIDWFPYTLGASDQADITNAFISFGMAAGLTAIVLFVWLLTEAFRSIGKKLLKIRLASSHPCEIEYLLWGLGVMLAGHVANFTAITYFDQFYVIWLMQLAFISNLTDPGQTGSSPAPRVRRVTPIAESRDNPVIFGR